MPRSKHSPEFRTMVSQEYIDEEGAVDDIIARYGISSRSILRRWIMEYNANRELKDYNPKQGVYMAGTRASDRSLDTRPIEQLYRTHRRHTGQDSPGSALIFRDGIRRDDGPHSG